MKPDGKKDSKDTRPDSLGRTYAPGDPLPAPEVVEKDTDTSWALFQALQEGGVDTQQAFPTTQADTLEAPAQRPASAGPGLEEVMFEARRNNRVCPLPAFWNRLCQLLQKETGKEPPPPVSPAAWGTTPSLTKRIALRAQVEWAGTNGALLPMYAYFRMLPEDKWHHMGD